MLDSNSAQPGPHVGSVGSTAPVKPHRVISIDALRGFNMFWIIGGDGLAWSLQHMLSHHGAILSGFGDFAGLQLSHVEWEGFRFYDFIFPLFVFVTGVAIPFSLTRLVEREGTANAYKRILRRFALLFVLGILYYGGLSHKWPDIRLLGVLQRIAICYFAASVLFLNFRVRGLVATVAVLLIGYWALMTFVPVPWFGAGSYAEGQNLANWIDLHYLPGSLWNITWDPEGLLSTLPAIATCVLGVLAGMLVKSEAITPLQKSLWLIGGGIVMVLSGHLWGLQFPIIKSIWTSSFVLVAGGYSAILLGAMHQIVDVWGWRAWATAFVWIGANAITLYFLNNVASFGKFAKRFVGGDVAVFLNHAVSPGAADFAANIVALAIAIALAGYLYRRKIFLRV